MDQRDPDISFCELEHIKQVGTHESYISEFPKVAVMVIDISESRMILLFTQGLVETLRGLVKSYRPTTLQEAVSRTRDLQDEIPRTKYPLRPSMPLKFKNKRPMVRKFPSLGKKYYSYKDQDESRRKNICFSYQETWVSGHKCVKGKAHYIEVFSESDEDMVEDVDMDDGEYEIDKEEEHLPQTNKKIAVLNRVPRFHTLRLKGVLQGQIITVVVDGGSTHNFIDAALVKKREIPTESFEGFIVVILGNHTMECNRWIPNLQVNLEYYTVKDNFYVVNVVDANMVFGVNCCTPLENTP